MPTNTLEQTILWRRRSASVIGWLGRSTLKRALEAIPDESWTLNGNAQGAEVAGLVDVDLGFTPATNPIQLRRLALSIGHEAEVPVAYLLPLYWDIAKLRDP